MVEQQRKSSQAESTPELNPQEQFIANLYLETVDWLINDQKGTILSEFAHQDISNWDSHQDLPDRIAILGIDLQKAVIIQTPDRYFGLVLGKRRRSKWDSKPTLGLQFGALPLDSRLAQKDKNTDMLQTLVEQRMLPYGSGEFFVHDMSGKVTIYCWADDSRFTGGRNIQEWSEERLLTDEGLSACLEIIQRTSKNAFIR